MGVWRGFFSYVRFTRVFILIQKTFHADLCIMKHICDGVETKRRVCDCDSCVYIINIDKKNTSCVRQMRFHFNFMWFKYGRWMLCVCVCELWCVLCLSKSFEWCLCWSNGYIFKKKKKVQVKVSNNFFSWKSLFFFDYKIKINVMTNWKITIIGSNSLLLVLPVLSSSVIVKALHLGIVKASVIHVCVWRNFLKIQIIIFYRNNLLKITWQFVTKIKHEK